jgi:hypothetical protein
MQRRKLALLLPLALMLGACTYQTDDGYDGYGGYCGGPPPQSAPQSDIDTGATVGEVTPGQGAGAFVEYKAGGQWHVYTTCDTALPNSEGPCDWDIIVSGQDTDTIQSYQPDQLESGDALGWDACGSVHLVAEDTDDFDGFFFNATPGATIRVDVYLDGGPAPTYIYWVGDGGLHNGAPSNPIDLTPTSP